MTTKTTRTRRGGDKRRTGNADLSSPVAEVSGRLLIPLVDVVVVLSVEHVYIVSETIWWLSKSISVVNTKSFFEKIMAPLKFFGIQSIFKALG